MTNSWENVLIRPKDSLEIAIRVIDKEALRMALVVDKHRNLLGTVSDGDIRRALINHMSLETEVEEVMNPNPIVAELKTTKDILKGIMQAKNLLALPLVDDGKVVGLETLHQALEAKIYDNPVFIMAGGFGKRLRPLTDNCPKPMLLVGGKPMLQIIIESLAHAGFHNFYISTHYMPDLIKEHFGDGENWGVSINYVYEQRPLGTGGALGLLPNDLHNLPLIMMNGDILTKVDFEELLYFHSKHQAVATMGVREYNHQIPYGVVSSNDHQVTGMVEKPSQKFFVNAGVYVLEPNLVKSVQAGQKIDMPTLLQKEIDAGKYVSMFPLHEYWLDIGQIKDFDQAQEDIKLIDL